MMTVPYYDETNARKTKISDYKCVFLSNISRGFFQKIFDHCKTIQNSYTMKKSRSLFQRFFFFFSKILNYFYLTKKSFFTSPNIKKFPL